MARYFCKHNHEHGTIEAAKYCDGSPPAALPQPRPAQTIDPAKPQLRVIHVFGDPTVPMLDFVGRLPGGDVAYARTLNRGECGEYIKSLKAARDGQPATVAASSMSMAVPDSRPPVPTLVPVGLLTEVQSGNYAVRADETKPWVFFRLSRPKSGDFAGMLKVQSQHGPRYALVLTVNVRDQIKWYERSYENDLLLLIADQQWAAIMYSQKKQKCCRCNTKLTHDDSLRYGIGPECIKHWPWVPERLAQAKAERTEV